MRVTLDDRDLRGGEKNWQHIKRGVPMRLEIGPQEIDKNTVFLGRRDTGAKASVERGEFVATVAALLDEIQSGLFQRALELRERNTRRIDDLDEFRAFFTPHDAEQTEIHGGFALCHWSDGPETARILDELKVTIRCIPFDGEPEEGRCIFTGRPSDRAQCLRRRIDFSSGVPPWTASREGAAGDRDARSALRHATRKQPWVSHVNTHRCCRCWRHSAGTVRRWSGPGNGPARRGDPLRWKARDSRLARHRSTSERWARGW